MMLARRETKLDSALDSVPIAFLLASWLGLLIGMSSGRWRDLWDAAAPVVLLNLAFPILTALWVLMRMRARLIWLCHRPRREELLLTSLDMRNWLRSHLQEHLTRLFASLPLNLFVTFTIGFASAFSIAFWSQSPEAIAITIIALLVVGFLNFFAIVLSLIGIFEAIRKSCTSGGRDSDVSATLLRWGTILVLTPAGVIFFGLLTFGIVAWLAPPIWVFYGLRKVKDSWKEALTAFMHCE